MTNAPRAPDHAKAKIARPSDGELDAELFLDPREAYPGQYFPDLLEQYKLYVQTHEHISERREGSNKFFVGLNTLILGAIGLRTSDNADSLLIILVCIGAIAICAYWRRAIIAYDQLNTGKFKVIHLIERRLPLSPYETEWSALGKGVVPTLYKPVSHIERGIPAVFALVYVGIALLLLWRLRAL